MMEKLRTEDRWQSVVRGIQDARSRGLDQPPPLARGWLQGKGRPVPHDRQAIVLLVDFSDNEADEEAYPPGHYDEMLFSEGTYPTGSMHDWYVENSYGGLHVTGQVTIWLRMPETYAYYVNGQAGSGDYPHNAQKLAEDAVSAADPFVDFSLFDNDGPDGIPDSGDDDGFVDALFVVHAGPGREETGSDDDIHSHAWAMQNPVSVDGVIADGYSMEPDNGKIGVFGHELGHVLGLPDLYDTDHSSSGIGFWGMMAAGSWGNDGTSPVHFTAWSKSQLGFLEPIVVAMNVNGAECPQTETGSVAYRLWTDGQLGQEYFLVENRQRVLFDAYLPGDGILVYHVDESIEGNQDENHPLLAVKQADGLFELQSGGAADAGDPFPGTSGAYEFSGNTTPDSDNYDDQPTDVAVCLQTDSQPTMIADLQVSISRVYLVRPDGTGDFPTIQDAIDFATNGDTIELADGTFTGPGNYELLFRGKSITVRSQSGNPAICSIDCQGLGRAVGFTQGEQQGTVLEGLMITGGDATASTSSPKGGAMRCWDSSPLIRNCVFVENTAESGGAIWCSNASPLFLSCDFATNFATVSSGGATVGGTPSFVDCVFTANTANSGGAGAISAPAVSATSCEFYDNYARTHAGAVSCNTGTFQSCLFDANRTGPYGNGALYASGDAVLRSCTFNGNTTNGAAGAVGVDGSALIDSCAFVGNVGDRGGALNHDYGNGIVSNCIFMSNSAAVYGGGIYGFNVDITNSLFFDNWAPQGGGWYGCGTMSSSTLADNGADLGAGVYVTNQYPCELNRVIIAFSSQGSAIYRHASADTCLLTCCGLYGNVGGNWIDSIEDQLSIDGNISEDPLFCDPDGGNFYLQVDSPCAPYSPPNPECDLIGAYPADCAYMDVPETPAEIMTPFTFDCSPNPSSSSVRLIYSIPAGRDDVLTRLNIFDITGRHVETLVDGQRSPGTHEIVWTALGHTRNALPAGVYFHVLQAGERTLTRRVLLMR